ncbi:hypothetical protein ACQUJS_02995 [Ralstonia pseudosolanacearum]|uniref:Uncharacterized protein n=1 Tax=Ralstonia solanacearum TaxID=305 RepID=A0A0S4TXA2_RALSL|nr:hypothetical protein RSP799_07075 [Ralstonia solanacearum]CUV14669.1 protein of unknown function [Ralstonia solanacearum]
MHLKELYLLKSEKVGTETRLVSRMVVSIDGRSLEASIVHHPLEVCGPMAYVRAHDARTLRQRIMSEIENEIFRGLR